MSTPSTDPVPRPEPSKRTSMAPSSNRHSKLPSAPPPPLSLHPRCLPAENALIVGTHPISLAENAVVHPYARLDSTLGPISLGESAIVWEKAFVGVQLDEVDDGLGHLDRPGKETRSSGDSTGMSIVVGRYVTIGSGAVVAAASLGEGSVIDTGAMVGRGCVLGEYCRIAPNVVLPPNTHLPAYTVVTAATTGNGSLQTRTNVSSRDNERVRMLKEKGHDKQIEMMRKLLKVNLAKWGFTV